MRSTTTLTGESYRQLQEARNSAIDDMKSMLRTVSSEPSDTLITRIACAELEHELEQLRLRWQAEGLINKPEPLAAAFSAK